MAAQLNSVQPGDLIKAEDWNKVVSLVNALDNRLTALESAGSTTPNAPVLTGRNPTGDLVVGSRLTLTGRNFLDPPNLNIVTFQNANQVVTINQFLPESDDRNLVFSLPSSVFGGLPADMTVAVSNRNGHSSGLSIRVLPLLVIPQGQVVIPPPTLPVGTILAGSSYVYSFSVASETNVPELYELRADYNNVVGASLSAWRSATQVSPTGIQQIARGAPLAVQVTVSIPTGAVSADLSLNVRSLNNDAVLTRSSDPVPITVGQQQEANDPRTSFTMSDILSFFDAHTRNATIDSLSGAEVQYGQTGRIRVTASFTDGGRYRYDAQIENAGALWSIDTGNITAPTDETPGSQQIVIVPVTCLANGPANEQRFMRIYAYHRNASDTADDFASFIRFPIRGFL